MILEKLRQALGLLPIDPDLVAKEELPLTARMIQNVFDKLPDDIQLIEEEENND